MRLDRILRRLVVLSVLGLVAYGAYTYFGGGRARAPQPRDGVVYVDPSIGAR